MAKEEGKDLAVDTEEEVVDTEEGKDLVVDTEEEEVVDTEEEEVVDTEEEEEVDTAVVEVQFGDKTSSSQIYILHHSTFYFLNLCRRISR